MTRDPLRDREQAEETRYAVEHQVAWRHLMHDAGPKLGEALIRRNPHVLEVVLAQRANLGRNGGQVDHPDGRPRAKLNLKALGLTEQELATGNPMSEQLSDPVRTALDAKIAKLRSRYGQPPAERPRHTYVEDEDVRDTGPATRGR